jgi:hypothetical protein
MLSISDGRTKCSGGITRRDFLHVGSLALGALALPHVTLADVLRSRDQVGDRSGRKSVILIWLRGGMSHIDSFDMKPSAPVEIRGEFNPIATNVPGIQICEYLPLTASIMDRLAIVRGIKSNDLGDHTPHYIVTGNPDRGKRPAFGSVVSHLRPRRDGLPTYASLMYERPGLYDNEAPLYVGPAHRPFAPNSEGLANLSLSRDITLDRLHDRRRLLGEFDHLGRAADRAAAAGGVDAYTRQAIEMISSPKVRDAFDLDREPRASRERYGKFCENFLLARRLAEAGVAVITLKVGDWDTHEYNFRDMRAQLPPLDRGFHALVSDLYERGLERDVAVVLWGEFGRSPRVDTQRIEGRDHWPEAGAAVIAGGGFRVGQTIGETDAHAARSRVTPYTPGHILASMYQHLGIDPALTIADFNDRPVYLLDDRAPVREL